MSEVFPGLMTVACRACGATRGIPSSDGPPDICRTCWSAANAKDADDFNQWLANKLLRDLRRLKHFGVTGRCEAISNPPYGIKGYQCGKPATMLRDGRRVCSSHGEIATSPAFIDCPDFDQYDTLAQIVKDLATADTRFRQAVKAAIE